MNESQRRAVDADQAQIYAHVTEQLRGSTEPEPGPDWSAMATEPFDQGDTMPDTPLKQMVQVHNFKDDPEGDRDSFYGPFDPIADATELAAFIADLRNSDLADFCSFAVIELRPPSLESARIPWFGTIHAFAGASGQAVPMPSHPIAGIEAYLVDDSDDRHI